MSNEINNLIAFDKFVVDKNKKILWCQDELVKLPLKAVEIMSAKYEVTELLVDWSEGDEQAAERLIPLVYQELHRLA